MEDISLIPNTEVLANKHKDNVHEYLIYSNYRRRVSYYERRIAFSEAKPFNIDTSKNRKTNAVRQFLYEKQFN